MKTYYGNIENFDTLNFNHIERIEQRCRQHRSNFIFDSIKTFIGSPINIVQQIVGNNTKK